jgi:hypothetical protein
MTDVSFKVGGPVGLGDMLAFGLTVAPEQTEAMIAAARAVAANSSA